MSLPVPTTPLNWSASFLVVGTWTYLMYFNVFCHFRIHTNTPNSPFLPGFFKSFFLSFLPQLSVGSMWDPSPYMWKEEAYKTTHMRKEANIYGKRKPTLQVRKQAHTSEKIDMSGDHWLRSFAATAPYKFLFFINVCARLAISRVL